MNESKIQQYVRTHVDWRKSISDNRRKTFTVMVLFVTTYTLFGLLIDLFVYVCNHNFKDFNTIQHSFSQSFDNIVSSANSASSNLFDGTALEILAYANQYYRDCIQGTHFPFFVILLQLIAIVAIIWTRYSNRNIILMGTKSKEIKIDTKDQKEKQALNILQELKIAASLPHTPKLYVIDSPAMNAFASGWDEKNALIAITKPLLNTLKRDELQAVLAHELSHIRHHDIKIILTVTVLSNIMLIIMEVLYRATMNSKQGVRKKSVKSEKISPIITIGITIIYAIVTVLNSLLIMYLSRTREFLADAGAVELLRNNNSLARALLTIEKYSSDNKEEKKDYERDTAHENLRYDSYISPPKTNNRLLFLTRWFNTHPSIEERLKAIGFVKETT